jgi:hypothetical protein
VIGRRHGIGLMRCFGYFGSIASSAVIGIVFRSCDAPPAP